MKSKQSLLIALFFVIVFIAYNPSIGFAQEVLKIQKKDNTVLTIPTSEIVKITFESSIPPLTDKTVTDVDGNIYNTVKIGYQTWMAENLKTTKYNDGMPIQNIMPKEAWKNSETGSYCWYDNIFDYGKAFGALYNWHAVASNKLCPSGWHVSTEDDWKSLGKNVGMYAGIKIKEVGTAHWKTNTNATNETGFTALPGGYRHDYSGTFYSVNTMGSWWTSSPNGENKAVSLSLYSNKSPLEKPIRNKATGLSVRCVKN